MVTREVRLSVRRSTWPESLAASSQCPACQLPDARQLRRSRQMRRSRHAGGRAVALQQQRWVRSQSPRCRSAGPLHIFSARSSCTCSWTSQLQPPLQRPLQPSAPAAPFFFRSLLFFLSGLTSSGFLHRRQWLFVVFTMGHFVAFDCSLLLVVRQKHARRELCDTRRLQHTRQVIFQRLHTNGSHIRR